MDPGRLNKRVTLQTPTRSGASGPYNSVTSWSTAGTVNAEVHPVTPNESLRFGGQVQTGQYIVTLRRPFQVSGSEVHPDRDWRLTFTEGGVTRTLQVNAVVDATWRAPAPYYWQLACTEART
jgi:SPP1 family predicted phage head-tail adaptor